MAVSDGRKYLAEAIDSILSQTFTDFEFLIVNDASVDDSVEIIKAHADPRIRLLHNSSRIGLAASLNKGLRSAGGEYVARMDCDDISARERLALQAGLLDLHPEVGVCGAWIKFIGETSGKVFRYYPDPGMNKSLLLFDPPVAHPSVMFRKSAFLDHGLFYDESYEYAQDYELWSRASFHMEITNIQKVLVHYRVHPKQTGNRSFEKQQTYAGKVRRAHLSSLGLDMNEEEFRLHQFISKANKEEMSMDLLRKSGKWLVRIMEANREKNIYPEPAFQRSLGMRWFYLCLMASSLGFPVWIEFLKSPLRGWRVGNWKQYGVNFMNALLARE
jgi:glycosyltransferase involved in cell wall biosynthesis